MDVEENIGSEMRNKGHWVETGHIDITMIWQGLSNIKIKVKSECEIQKDTERTRVRQEEKGNKKKRHVSVRQEQERNQIRQMDHQ